MAAHLVRHVDGFGLDTSIECASQEWPCFGGQVVKKIGLDFLAPEKRRLSNEERARLQSWQHTGRNGIPRYRACICAHTQIEIHLT